MTDQRNYPQPHEGVSGQADPAPLLSLAEEALPYRAALVTLTGHLNRATLVGDPAPIAQRIQKRISTPEPGDFVCEMSSLGRSDPDQLVRGFGRLLLHRDEWWETNEEWAACLAEDSGLTDEDRAPDHVWYIQYGPAAEELVNPELPEVFLADCHANLDEGLGALLGPLAPLLADRVAVGGRETRELVEELNSRFDRRLAGETGPPVFFCLDEAAAAFEMEECGDALKKFLSQIIAEGRAADWRTLMMTQRGDLATAGGGNIRQKTPTKWLHSQPTADARMVTGKPGLATDGLDPGEAIIVNGARVVQLTVPLLDRNETN